MWIVLLSNIFWKEKMKYTVFNFNHKARGLKEFTYYIISIASTGWYCNYKKHLLHFFNVYMM